MAANYSLFISLLLILLQLSLVAHLTSASDSITPTTPFSSSSQNLTSDGGKFALGFYSPPGNARYYVAIWYNTIREVTPVWIANRETPFSDPASARISIASDGNLVLTAANSTTPIWSTNATGLASNSTVAKLNNTGNLVLRNGSGKILWQSIDHPTDTWLPGGKLSRNKLTGKSQHLTSWKNADDPAPGLFSLVLDPDGSSQYIILYNDTNSYWTSGTWNGQIFSLVPEMTSNYIYQFDYVTNETDEDYFTYSLRDDSITTRFIMDVSGQIKQETWVSASQSWNLFWSQPRAQCDVWALCGAYGVCSENQQSTCDCLKGFQQRSPADWALSDRSGGCERTTLLRCQEGGKNPSSNGEQDKFWAMPNTNLPANGVSVAADGEGACQAFCLSNCSCTAYSADTGCSVWYGGLLNVQTPATGNGNTLHLRLAASELPSSGKSKGTLAGAVAGVGAGIVILLAAACLLIRRRRRKSSSKAVDGTLVPFRYSELARATKDFSHRLGGGGFGSVFKGTLPDSTAVAVKKLEGLQQGEKQFRTEVSTIGTIQHVNLVRLHGFCSQGTNKLLVYEYMPHGSLDTQLFKRDSSSSSSVLLDWEKRYQIALGTARGLFYLHEKCRDCIIHCDIKPENILLDDSFTPKVADFGLAKLVGRDFSRVLTTMRGTRGYLAPEWITGVPITAKADVYSYGMMLFEIVSGRRNSEQTDDGSKSGGFFPKFAAAKMVAGDTISVLDERLGGDANLEELDRACKVACWCIQDDEDFRPSMGQVVQILEGNLQVGMPPIPRSLQVLGYEEENIVFFSDMSSTQSSQARSTTSTSTASQTKSTTSVSD